MLTSPPSACGPKARRGHQVALFVPPYDGPQDSGLCWRDGDVTVYNVALPRGARGAAGGLWHLRLAWRLLAAVRAWRPDVVHVFKPKGPSGLVAAALWEFWGARPGQAGSLLGNGAARRPALVVDADDWEGPAGWNDDPRAGYSALQRRVFAWQERYGLAHAGAWTVASNCLAERAARCGASAGRVFLLPNGIADPGAWAQPREARESGGPPSALLYTRFAGVRVAEVADIWRRVAALAPAATLTVVGRGLGGEEWELARQAPNVRVAGWLEPAEMPAFFAGQAAALVPWADTPPNRARSSAKVLELMAAGLPIVAYAVGDLPVTLGDAGILVPPGDAPAFAGAVAGLLADPARARRLGQAACRRIQAEYTWERLSDVALAAYAAARGLHSAPS